MEITSYKR